jgi:hypothetical protein
MATLLITCAVLYILINMINMPPLCYSREELLNLKPCSGSPTGRVPLHVYRTLRNLNICSVEPTKRGHRAFNHSQHPIPTITTSRITNKYTHHPPRGVNFSNLQQLPRYDAPKTQLNVCLWNIQSLRYKTVQFSEYVLEHDIDIMIVTESWLRNDDHVIIGESTPPGYSFLNIPRPDGTSYGGIAIVFKSQLQLRLRTNPSITTYFESACITDNVGLLNLVVIYRPFHHQKIVLNTLISFMNLTVLWMMLFYYQGNCSLWVISMFTGIVKIDLM